jgi:hypothetical protein
VSRRAALLLALLAACATTPSGPEVRIELEQITSSAEFRFAGPVNVQYRLTAFNPTADPVNFARIELRTVGPGAYVLREPSIPINVKVPPGSTAALTVTARGAASGGQTASIEPVTVRAVAYFDGPKGPFTHLLNVSFDQLGRR